MPRRAYVSNLQDGTIVHVEGSRPGGEGSPAIVGEDALVGHMAILHGCTLEDRAFVGLGAIVMDGCRIGSDAMLAAGALLSPGKAIPARQLWVGRPAQYQRDLPDAAIAEMRRGVAHYVENGRAHAAALAQLHGDGAAQA